MEKANNNKLVINRTAIKMRALTTYVVVKILFKTSGLSLLTDTSLTPIISEPKSTNTIKKKAIAIPTAVFPKFSSPQIETIYGTTNKGVTKLKS